MTTTVHRARTSHSCNGYGAWQDYSHQIEPGGLFLREVVFPGQEGNEEGDRPITSRTCEACIDRYGGGQWIRDKYGVPAHLGGTVEYEGARGTIVDLRNGAVTVRLDGRTVFVHAADLRYLVDEEVSA
jgi:hypothetical protein